MVPLQRPRLGPRIGGAVLVLGGLVAVAAYAIRWEPYHPRLRRCEILVPANWPRLDVLHISDLHLRQGDKDLLRAQLGFLARIRMQPDLVCATGDLCEEPGDVELVTEVLNQVRPRLGTYAVLGNHEYDAAPPVKLRRRPGGVLWKLFKFVFPHRRRSRGAADADAIAAQLGNSGICVLRNDGVRLSIDGIPLWLAGGDSAWAGRADLAAALRGRRVDEATLALVHEPDSAFAAVEHGADLVLAGHTHGGQVRLPGVGALYYHRADDRLQVSVGLQNIDRALLHISAGLGQLLPLRFLCRPEAVWLRCVPAGERTLG